MSDDLLVDDDITIPEAELEWRFETSGGPGGQHANKAATRAVLSFDLGATGAIQPEVRDRIVARLGNRAEGGVVTVAVDESRSQWRNRQMARRRLADILREANRPIKKRKPTKPSRSARRRRVENKRQRGELKKLRRPPEV